LTRQLLIVALLGGALSGTGCREAFTAHVTMVARADGAELPVSRLAEMIATAPDVPVEREVVELLARRWVEFTLLARRTAAGDSLLDSAWVVEAMWPDIQRLVVDSLREVMTQDLVNPAPNVVDSAYRAGNLRYVAHILQRASPDASADVRQAKRVAAQQIRERLAGGETWETLNRLNDDTAAASRGGVIGPLVRGTTVPRFENAAFALGPGEVSDVTETNLGFHVILRPELNDVRPDFGLAVEAHLRRRADSAIAQQVLEQYGVEVTNTAPATIRQVGQDPFRARSSRKALATYDGGRFVVEDLVRWIQVLRPDVVQRLSQAPDEQLVMLTRSLVGQDLLWRRADSMGIDLRPEQFAEIRARYAQQLGAIRGLLGARLDSVPEDQAVRDAQTDLRVERYLEAAVASNVQFVPVPPFLAERLLQEADWAVRTAGVARVVEQARRMRAAMEPDDQAGAPGGQP